MVKVQSIEPPEFLNELYMNQKYCDMENKRILVKSPMEYLGPYMDSEINEVKIIEGKIFLHLLNPVKMITIKIENEKNNS